MHALTHSHSPSPGHSVVRYITKTWRRAVPLHDLPSRSCGHFAGHGARQHGVAVPRHYVASRNFTTRYMTAWRRAAYQHDDVATRGTSPRRSEARSISKTWCRVVSLDGVARSLCSTWCRAVYQHDKTTWCSPFDLRSIGRQRGRYMTLIGINFYNATHRPTFSTS